MPQPQEHHVLKDLTKEYLCLLVKERCIFWVLKPESLLRDCFSREKQPKNKLSTAELNMLFLDVI